MKCLVSGWLRGIVVSGFVLLLEPAGAVPALIPQPQEVRVGEGKLALPVACPVWLGPDAACPRLAEVLASAGLAGTTADRQSAKVRLHRGEVANPHGFPGAYRLHIGADGVDLTANDPVGLVHGVETLRQLMDPGGDGVSLPCIEIADWPAFLFRGFMLDTGRNFQSLPLLKEQIEVMARYKLNVFHFHFTDNPGWRLESKVHPGVTAPASMSRQPGKFHTQAEFRDLVAYCAARGITLVPEMDMPGHSEAIRKALGIRSMNDAATRGILKDLLTELASLAPAETMPYIHLGTDEVRGGEEKVDGTFLPEMAAHVRSLGRKVIGWRKGLEDRSDTTRITQLWARAEPLPANPFLDSRSTYINHMDPHECVSTFLFQQPCRRPHGDARALGGVLCSWPDIRIESERDQLLQNPVYPAILTYAESLWRGVEKDDHERYWANLPPVGSPEFARFREFEGRLLEHKDRYFKKQPFCYVKQTDLRWRIIGPFPNGNDVSRSFPVEERMADRYEFEGRTYQWQDPPVSGATLYFNHFFGFGGLVKEKSGTCYAATRIWSPDDRVVPVWVGFHHTSRSDRRGAERSEQGLWHPSRPWARVNGVLIPPPVWKNTGPKTSEMPFTNEDYFMRPPAEVRLNKGWNEVLLKVPKAANGWKWVATFVPCGNTDGLRYSAEIR